MGLDRDDREVDDNDEISFDELRVGRRLLDPEEEEEDWVRMGAAWVWDCDSVSATPASTRTLEGLSMYASISRSLFHFRCRSRSCAVLNYALVSIPAHERERGCTHIDAQNATDVLGIVPDLLLDLGLAEGVVVDLVRLELALGCRLDIVGDVHVVVGDWGVIRSAGRALSAGQRGSLSSSSWVPSIMSSSS